ncbi:MAG TPA: iron-sulfur cluster repair di-iron protein [Vicinamibacterales bacterium]
MDFTRDTLVADLAAGEPATIKVFQQHGIEFCCGGRTPLGDACERHGLSYETLAAELREAIASNAPWQPANWQEASLGALIDHIQRRYHAVLREELPRLARMLDRVISRHGEQLPETLLPLRDTFVRFEQELLSHMQKEDNVLFPAIRALERPAGHAAWAGALEQPIEVMEHEHADAGEALARMRAITNGYAPPEWACPTFRGLYYGLAALESDMHVHVHLENNILFPRATALTRNRADATV